MNEQVLMWVAVVQAALFLLNAFIAWYTWKEWRDDRAFMTSLDEARETEGSRDLQSTIQDLVDDGLADKSDFIFVNEELPNGTPVLAVVFLGESAVEMANDLDIYEERGFQDAED